MLRVGIKQMLGFLSSQVCGHHNLHFTLKSGSNIPQILISSVSWAWVAAGDDRGTIRVQNRNNLKLRVIRTD